MFRPPGENSLDRDSQRFDSQATSMRPEPGTLEREWQLLSSISSTAGSGVSQRLQEIWDDKLGTGLDTAGSIAVGAALSVAARNPSMFGRLSALSKAAPKALSVLAVADLGQRIGAPMLDTWLHPENLESDKTALGRNLGAALIDYPLMGVTGGFGAHLGAKQGMRLADRMLSAEVAKAYGTENLSFKTFQEQLQVKGITAGDILDLATFDSEGSLADKTNLAGSGWSHHVVRIPEVDRFLTRFTRMRQPEGAELTEVKDPLPGLNIGQAVARLGDLEILKEQTGVPAGMPKGFHEDYIDFDTRVPIYKSNVDEVAQMPQSAYDSFARLLKVLNRNKLAFDDHNGNNVLIDHSRERFNIVDVHKLGQSADDGPPSAFHMILGLTDSVGLDHIRYAPVRESLKDSYRTIVEKSMRAAVTTDLPLAANEFQTKHFRLEYAGLNNDALTLMQRHLASALLIPPAQWGAAALLGSEGIKRMLKGDE